MMKMTRQSLLQMVKATIFLFVLLAAISCSLSPEKNTPNIIYILADDLGYGELGSYGQEKIETPNIDQLADAGMIFSDHYSGAPVCAPSRCVLLTGKHLGHAYIRGNDEWSERGPVWNFAKAVEDPNLEGQRPLPADIPTLGAILQNAGYKTGIVGKWGLGGPLTDGIPTKRGFDFFYGYNCQRQAHTLYPKHLWKNEEKVWLDNELVVPGTKLQAGADPEQDSSYASYSLTDYAPELMHTEALDFIKSSKDEPFFLYYASPLPHVPLQAPERWVEYYHKKFGDEEPYDGSKGYFPARNPRATYAAMISYLDEQVGDIVALLKELDLYDNTLIIFSSDNGPSYAGGTDSPWFNSGGTFNSEYGSGKGFVKEGGIRVPMIASWPARIDPSSSTNHISAFYDVLPTLCDITNAEQPEDIDGVSFLPTLLGKKQKEKNTYYYWEYPEYGGQIAIRMGHWKGIALDIKKKDKIEIELYDLENDPLENNNIAADHPEIIEEFINIIKLEHIKPEIDRFSMKQLEEMK